MRVLLTCAFVMMIPLLVLGSNSYISTPKDDALLGHHGSYELIPVTNFIEIGNIRSAPRGYPEFCGRNPDICSTFELTSTSQRVQLDQQKWDELNRINAEVNRLVKPKDDQVQYGEMEYWAIPEENGGNYYGDCEDYVLLKQQLLHKAGWPFENLSIAYVESIDRGRLHAVLTVRTNDGDFILDNVNKEIQLWKETRYFFIAMQIASGMWAEIADRRFTTAPLLASEVSY